MPLYEFECADGHRTEHLVELDGSDAPSLCPKLVERNWDGMFADYFCDAPLARVEVSAPASSFPGAASWRK